MSLEKNTQYLKITEKVSFNIASKASYDYSAEKKLIKNAKNYQFGEFLKSEAYDQTVLPDRSAVSFERTKISGKCQKSPICL